MRNQSLQVQLPLHFSTKGGSMIARTPKPKVIGKCAYCGNGVRTTQAVRISDPSVMVGVPPKPKKWLAHSAASGYHCEGFLTDRLNQGKVVH